MLVDHDLEHEIDRSLNYHENLDNIPSIHCLADQVTHYEVERELELIEKQLQRSFRAKEIEIVTQQIESRPPMTNPVGNELENNLEVISDYYELLRSGRFVGKVNLAGGTRKIGAKPIQRHNIIGKRLSLDECRHLDREKINSRNTESFDKSYAEFIRKAGNRGRILTERRKARALLNKWDKILRP
jgi:hypothetical protein